MIHEYTSWLFVPNPYVQHEEVTTSRWLSFVFAEVIERWGSYNNLILYYDGYLTMSMQIIIDYTLHCECSYGKHYENAHAHTLWTFWVHGECNANWCFRGHYTEYLVNIIQLYVHKTITHSTWWISCISTFWRPLLKSIWWISYISILETNTQMWYQWWNIVIDVKDEQNT